ncbi:MAG: PAS domain-containing protein [Opitutaceae bacterium]|nr:PAS domain-containing protein [Opitutaceae bacterium]
MPFTSDKLARMFFERLMESLPDSVYFKDREGRFFCLSKALATHFGLDSPEEAIGKSDYDFFPEELARIKDHDEREIVRTGVGFVGKEEKSYAIGGKRRWVLSSKLPLYGDDGSIIGTFGISRDITEVKQARESLEAQHRLLKTLIEILPCRIFVKDRDGRITLTNEAYRRALGLHGSDIVEGKRLSDLVADDRVGPYAMDDRLVIEKGTEILNREDFDASPLGDKRWMLLSKVPLRDGEGQVQGLVGMAADITAQKEAEARAVRIQHQLEEKNRQIEAELALARELQTELMTSSLVSVREQLDATGPLAPRIAFHYEASVHLAGDFFQLIPITRRRFGMLLCDVMGHGVKAALVTTLIRGLITDVKADELSPERMLARLNDRLCTLLDRPPLPRFVTALYALVDLDEARLTVASAGHAWPLYRTAAGETAPLCSLECGPALGLIRGATFTPESRRIATGDRLLCFTDGWIEESNPAGEEYGTRRLASGLDRHAADQPDVTLAEAARDVRHFAAKSSFSDDLCAVLVQFGRTELA